MAKIAYLGPAGTFTEQAARLLSVPDDELFAVATIAAAVSALRSGAVEAACVPIENSVEGGVPASMDTLALGDPVVAVAEVLLPIHFTALLREGITSDQVVKVGSHPHALAQVRGWVDKHFPTALTVATTSTAAAAAAAQAGEVDLAIVAPIAVENYSLPIFATEIADVADARTRFLLVRKPGTVPTPTGKDRTSIILSTAHKVGALSEVLQELSLRGVNLTRIESRPIKDRPGEYLFYFDLEGHVAGANVGDALAALQRKSHHVRFLGSYPQYASAQVEVSLPSNTDADFAAAATWLAAIREGETA